MTTDGQEDIESVGAHQLNDPQEILRLQVEILRNLNDERLRTLRLHAALGGAVIAGISFLGPSSIGWSGGSDGDFLFWLLFVSIAFISGTLWLLRLISIRLSYTDLRLGMSPRFDESIRRRSDESGWVEQLQRVLLPGSPDKFDELYEKAQLGEEFRKEDYTSVIHHNNWILVTREEYVNSLQRGLNVMFVLTVLSILGVLSS